MKLQSVVQGRKLAFSRVQMPLTDEFLEWARERQKNAICSYMLGSAILARACTHCAGASRERERNSFFDSLRRKSRSPSLAPLGEGEDTPAGAAAPTEAAADTATLAEAPKPASPATLASPAQHVSQQSAATQSSADNHQQHTPAAAGSAAAEIGEIGPIKGATDKPDMSGSTEANKGSSSSLSDRLRIPAEEEAFLRSLGWDGSDLGDDDDEEGTARQLYFPSLQPLPGTVLLSPATSNWRTHMP